MLKRDRADCKLKTFDYRLVSITDKATLLHDIVHHDRAVASSVNIITGTQTNIQHSIAVIDPMLFLYDLLGTKRGIPVMN